MIDRPFLGLRFSAFLIGIMAFMSYVTIFNLKTSHDWVIHSKEVISQISYIRNIVTDSVVSSRGFVITEDPNFLKEYAIFSRSLDEEMDQLQILTKDNDTQQENIIHLRNNIDRLLLLLKRDVDTVKDEGKERASRFVAEGIGRKYLEEIRRYCNIMINEEERLLDIRTKESYKWSNWSLYALPFFLIVDFFILNVSIKNIRNILEKGN
jgi:CHASE3 domain sensor protein